jgi:glycosyltransferase involved in cell wall biosynthesis
MRDSHSLNKNLPVHFFTIVLNGKPFIEYHESVLNALSFDWHWHIIEGVATLTKDTGWSLENGGKITEQIHNNGLSNDGTTEYLDVLVAKHQKKITVYRKGSSQFWNGKQEMVSAPLANISETCLLWQIDSDELWTSNQITQVRNAFINNPTKTAANYWCWYFVGPNKVINSRNCYAQNPNQEWLRTWLFEPGDIWGAHEPPTLLRLTKEVNNKSKLVNVAKIDPFTHDEMEKIGAVFQHFAYVTEAQIKFKEIYYGYRNVLEKWEELQKLSQFGYLKDYFSWVSDQTTFDSCDFYCPNPLAKLSEGKWTFSNSHEGLEEFSSLDNTFKRTPRIAIDGVFWQYLNSGIGRAWKNIFQEWVKSGFSKNVIVFDRDGTAPKIPGIQYWEIPKHSYTSTSIDASMLDHACKAFSIDLFVSTYYTTPIDTPSFFMGYDMIPEALGFPMTDATWLDKKLAIIQASGYATISENSTSDLKKFYPFVNEETVSTIPLACDDIFYPSDENELNIFLEIHHLIKNKYILMVGERLGYCGYKNGALAFKALALLNDPSLSLVCIGGNEKIERALIELAPNLKVIRLKMDDDELRAAYSGALALIYPSKYEGFGLPPLESMMCGTPVITCNNSSIPEVVDTCAIYVSETDPIELKTAIETLQQDIDLRLKLINRGLIQSKKFSFHKTAQALQNVLLKFAFDRTQQSSRELLFRHEFRNLQSKLQLVETSNYGNKQYKSINDIIKKYTSIKKWMNFFSRKKREFKNKIKLIIYENKHH